MEFLLLILPSMKLTSVKLGLILLPTMLLSSFFFHLFKIFLSSYQYCFILLFLNPQTKSMSTGAPITTKITTQNNIINLLHRKPSKRSDQTSHSKKSQNKYLYDRQQCGMEGSLIILLHLFSKAMSVTTRQCEHCSQIVKIEKYHEHMNQHTQPHELVPKTLPNSVRKIGLSKVLHIDDSTDQSDIAVRSILPDQMPRPEVERPMVPLPQMDGVGKAGKVGSASRVQMIGDQGAPANDRLDLNSNPVWTDVQRYEEDPLNIEKVVDLKPKKTMVPRKEIHKYQNTHSAARETIDTGGCERKVQANPLSQSRNVMIAPPEPVYQIKEDVKPFLSLVTDPKATATVNFSRKTGQANPYNAIQTRSIADPNLRQRQRVPEDQFEDERYNKVGRAPSRYSEEQAKPRQREQERQYPLHPHECPDCHGFYCSTCKSTIPPSMRPFWDENQKPEIIQYYKSLQREYERRREGQHSNCLQCHPNKKVEQ